MIGALNHGVLCAPLTGGAISDPLHAYVLYLDHCDTLNSPVVCAGGPTFSDINLETTTVKFGGGSYEVGNVYAGFIHDTSGNLGTGSGDFVWEAWIYISSFALLSAIVTWGTNQSDTHRQEFYVATDGSIRYYTGSGYSGGAGDKITSSAGVVSINTWHFVQLLKINGTTKIGLDGAQVGSNFTDGNAYDNTELWVAQENVDPRGTRGFCDEFRFTRGATNTLGARTINLPTAAFPYP